VLGHACVLPLYDTPVVWCGGGPGLYPPQGYGLPLSDGLIFLVPGHARGLPLPHTPFIFIVKSEQQEGVRCRYVIIRSFQF